MNIVTGGAIMTALPLIMQIVSAVMAGVALGKIIDYVGQYLGDGWAGLKEKAAKSLARGLAIGAIELIFALIFNLGTVIKTLKTGLTASLKTAAKTVKATITTTIKNVKELGWIGLQAGKTMIKNGKMFFKGLKTGFSRGAKSLDELGRRLLERVRFRKFKIRIKNFRFQIYGYLNPWILLADGSLAKVNEDAISKSSRIGDDVSTFLGKGKLIALGDKLPESLKPILIENAKQGKKRLFDIFGIKPGAKLNLDIPSAPNERSYITYAFKDVSDKVVYVGRASGKGNPIEVLADRIAKGHEHFKPGLKAEVVAIQSSKPASQGAEEFFIQGFREEGSKLTNIAEALDIFKSERRKRSIMKLEEFFEEISRW